MYDSTTIESKKKSLKSAIERYDLFTSFINEYKQSNTLNRYIAYIKDKESSTSESMMQHYVDMIASYKIGNIEPLLLNLYDRLLFADENKTKAVEELKQSLNLIWFKVAQSMMLIVILYATL